MWYRVRANKGLDPPVADENQIPQKLKSLGKIFTEKEEPVTGQSSCVIYLKKKNVILCTAM